MHIFCFIFNKAVHLIRSLIICNQYNNKVMTELMLVILIGLVVVNTVIVLFKRPKIDIKPQLKDIEDSIIRFESILERTENLIKDEFQRNRNETNEISKSNREELTKSLDSFASKFEKNVKDLNDQLKSKHEDMRIQLSDFHKQMTENNKENRGELTNSLKSFETKFGDKTKELSDLLRQKFSKLHLSQNQETTKNVVAI